ncbi:MAG: PAS domain S-box protein [Nitrospira sp.]|nr:PAS domain S-box protein [Nitrospira sp.]
MTSKTIKKASLTKRKSPRRARTTGTTSRSGLVPPSVEELFAKAFRLSPHPIGIIEMETGRCLGVNDACLEIFGFQRHEVIGKTTLMLGIWPDPQERVRLIDRLRAEGKVRNLEVSMRVRDGALRRFIISTDWITLRGNRCLLTIDNDITERKQAEEALHQKQLELQQSQAQLQDLASKLLTAQDSERQRIARDLHDDFSQRLVALTLDLAALDRQPSLSPESLGKALEPVREELAQLSDDLRRLAHRLHPSLLKHAGLRAALEEHIQQAMKRTELRITLKVGNVPESLPLDSATCLFRVCQESLQNVVKHANATEVLVKLSGSSKGIGLSVTDNGRGFDLHVSAVMQ